jgi:uncharacterized protein (TIGR02246 family)
MPAKSAAPGNAAAEQAAIAAVTQRVVAAWAAHDADAFSRVFIEAGTMVMPGVYLKGRDKIRDYMANAFASDYKGTRVTGSPLNMQFLSESSGVLLTEGGVVHPGENKPTSERAIRASWIVVKENGNWQLAAYHNSQRDGD